MRVLPVVARELGAIARRPSAYWTRSAAAAAAFLALGYVALVGAAGFSTRAQGQSLFYLLSLGAFAFCVLAGIRGTSDALSQEKREGTLGLLFLTDLKGYDVVLGKLVSVSMNSVYGIFAATPALAFAFLLGGASVPQFTLMVAFLFNTIFFSLSVGIFVSTFSRLERPAMGATLAIIFLILVMPYALAAAHSYGSLEIWEVMLPGFLLTSPLFAFWTIQDPTLAILLRDEILLSMAFAHLLGWLCLVVASACVTERAHLDAPRGKFAERISRVWQQWAYGKAELRRKIRASLLDRSAFAWLAGRDRLKGRYAWVFLILLGGLWIGARKIAPEVMEEWPVTLLSLWFLQLFFKIWVASEVAARFIEDRRSNALELLLTTPLRIGDFVRGETIALARQFGPPLAAVVLLNIIATTNARDSSAYLFRSDRPGDFFIAGLIHLSFDLIAIFWMAIWRSLHLRGTNRTISQTVFYVVFLPVIGWFLLWQGSWLLAALAGGATQTAGGILRIWTIGCVIWDLILAWLARSAFYREFREVATQAYDKPAPVRWKFWAKRAGKSPPARRTHRTFKFTAAIAIIFIGLYGWALFRSHHLATLQAARVQAVRAAGFPVNVGETGKWRASDPAVQLAATKLRAASKIMIGAPPPPGLRDVEAALVTREKLPQDFKIKAEQWVATNGPLFKILEEIPDLGGAGTGLCDQPWTGLRTDEIATGLFLKTLVEMDDDPRAAAQSIAILLRFVRALQNERFGGFGAPMKGLKDATILMERAALRGGFAAAEWENWKDILRQLDPITVFHDSLVLERVEGLDVFSQPSEILYQRFARQFSEIPGLFETGWAIRRFVGQDHVEVIDYLDAMADYIDKSEKPFWTIPRTGIPRGWREPRPLGRTFITPQLLFAFEPLFVIATETLAYQRVLMTAADVEIFRAGKHRLPESLSELGHAPLLDPFDGKPLRYLPRDEYVIYSIDQDCIDNGGDISRGRLPGDLAFRCGQLPARTPIKRENKP